MNNRGFTLVELLATLVVLGLVIGISVLSVNANLGKAKEKTEEVFVDTLRDAIDMYLSDVSLKFEKNGVCNNAISKKHGDVKVYPIKFIERDKSEIAVLNFNHIINSVYMPLTEAEFVNPANEDVPCNKNAVINVYRDEDFVYYYYVDKGSLGCLKNIGGDYESVITNLPFDDFDGDGIEEYYSCS